MLFQTSGVLSYKTAGVVYSYPSWPAMSVTVTRPVSAIVNTHQIKAGAFFDKLPCLDLYSRTLIELLAMKYLKVIIVYIQAAIVTKGNMVCKLTIKICLTSALT